jgi:hypothetical protein
MTVALRAILPMSIILLSLTRSVVPTGKKEEYSNVWKATMLPLISQQLNHLEF